MLQHHLPCQVCPGRGTSAAWAQHLSLVPKVPLHHLKPRFIVGRVDSAPGTQLGELLIQERWSEPGEQRREPGCFPKLAPFDPKARPGGEFVALISCAKTLEKFARKKR